MLTFTLTSQEQDTRIFPFFIHSSLLVKLEGEAFVRFFVAIDELESITCFFKEKILSSRNAATLY